MDYNDNDYEGQNNFHLGGEESSKVSSVLCSYALPKFDFDDSLQGHLRFDSLVENEVFLGIASQEDNQWIEDFSRGSGGIEFRSSAAESCSLPRHINVWSEATSSESVEMLLKAVGQEEMVPGEATAEETDPGDQSCGMMEQRETNFNQSGDIDDIKDPNPTSTPGELHEVVSVNQSVGAQGVQMECNLPAEERKDAADGSVDANTESASLGETREKLQNETEVSHNRQGEPSSHVNETSIDKIQENLPIHGVRNDTDCALHKITVSYEELNDPDKFRVIGPVSLSGLDEDISRRDEKDEKTLNADHKTLSGSDAQSVNSILGSASGMASQDESTGDHAVETIITEIGGTSSVSENVHSLLPTSGQCKDDMVEPEDGSKSVAVALSDVTGIKQQISCENKLVEGLSVSIQAEGTIEHASGGGNTRVLEICSHSELTIGSAISPDGQRSSVDNEDVHHGTNNLLKASPTTFRNNPSASDTEALVNPPTSLADLTVTSVAGGCVRETLTLGNLKDASNVAGMHTGDLNDEDHDGSSLLSESMQIDGETNPPTQTDPLKCDLDHSECRKGEDKSQFVGNDMRSDDNGKEVGSAVPGEGPKETVDLISVSESKGYIGDYPGVNTEVQDTNFASQVVPLQRDEDEETEFTAAGAQRMSILVRCSEMEHTVAPVSEAQKAAPCDPAVDKTVDYSVPTMETADGASHDNTNQEISESLEGHPVRGTIAPEGDGFKLAPVEKQTDGDIERNRGATSLMKPGMTAVTGGSTKNDQSNQVSGVRCPEHEQSEIKERESIKVPVSENVQKSGGKTPALPVSQDVSGEEGTFSFDVGPLACPSKGEVGNNSRSFPAMQAPKISPSVEGSLSASNNRQVEAKVVPEIPHGSPAALGGRSGGGHKGKSERKARRDSGKSSKESGKKGVKEITPLKQNDRGDKSQVSLSPSVTSQLMQFEIGTVERSATKPSGAVSVPTSYLPDLNTSASPSSLIHQPFTDLQQVQLRAQIFVYGSLIQGVAPDEACMVSAFDGGRSIWEPCWRSCVERVHSQKSQGNISETPVQSRSGAKASEQVSKHSLPQSNVNTPSASRASSMVSILPAVSPMIPLSSPLWNISTPSSEGLPSSSVGRSAIFDYQAVSPLHPYQTTPIRNFVSSTTSWPSQAPFHGPWVASSQSSAFDIGSTKYSAFPVTETVKLTPIKELSMPISSGGKNASPVPVSLSGAASTFGAPFSLVDTKKASISSGHNSTDTKTRKRKKTSGSEDPVQSSAPATQRDAVSATVLNSHSSKQAPVVVDLNPFSLLARSQIEPVSAPVVNSHYSTSVTVTTPSTFIPKSKSDKVSAAPSLAISSHNQNRGEINMDKRVINLEDCNKVEEAKLQAEAAAASAVTAIGHCQGVWSQLDKLKDAGLTSDAEAMLASASVTIAAAAAVAKAAAAAANIASKAAEQAKQMADDTVTKYATASDTRNNSVSLPMFVNSLGNATPASILKGGDGNGCSSSIISAAREAARKKVEVASAATRHAENVDAIVKAAELAAEAVSQAGKVAAMGDPLSLIELAEAGPDGYWKLLDERSLQAPEKNDINRNDSNNSNVNQLERPDNETVQMALTRNMNDDQLMAEDSLIASVKYRENNSKAQKDRRGFDSANTIATTAESDIESRSKSPIHDPNGSTVTIREGCAVEVLKEHGDLNKAWFPAKVLSLKDGEALVQYSKLQSDEGSELLEEWIPLAAEGGNAPIIRVPHPMSSVQLEGTRKRSRAAVRDHSWSVGDRVDAWMQDCWYEGVITEKNEKDQTSLSVHLSGQGNISVVKAWHLRPTLIWSDDHWIEWSRSRKDLSKQGDTPQEKRLKRGSTAVESKGKRKMSEDNESVETAAQEQPRFLPLSATDKVFSVGTNGQENKPDTTRTMRSGLQKDRSRVIFGVPKPGKKKKFMDVSKHYVSDKSTKTNVPSDSVKLSNYLIPQGSGSRGWRNSSKTDSKEKQAIESKPKILNSRKPPIPSRMVSRKDDSTNSKDENESVSSQETTQKRAPAAGTKSDRSSKGRLVPAGRKPANNDALDDSVSEAVEPRRSNRRIQPTSRLLEGLQSSLIISKVPSSSQDKAHRNYSKGTSRRD